MRFIFNISLFCEPG